MPPSPASSPFSPSLVAAALPPADVNVEPRHVREQRRTLAVKSAPFLSWTAPPSSQSDPDAISFISSVNPPFGNFPQLIRDTEEKIEFPVAAPTPHHVSRGMQDGGTANLPWWSSARHLPPPSRSIILANSGKGDEFEDRKRLRAKRSPPSVSLDGSGKFPTDKRDELYSTQAQDDFQPEPHEIDQPSCVRTGKRDELEPAETTHDLDAANVFPETLPSILRAPHQTHPDASGTLAKDDDSNLIQTSKQRNADGDRQADNYVLARARTRSARWRAHGSSSMDQYGKTEQSTTLAGNDFQRMRLRT
ncbi:hypothetical protein C8R45DRAFT_1106687 [Mycena sanguinolenta]|nr:hypothetical protein C8R45DRAFT_1106687 [Mycena sanguinolenta]